jgi:eukaryotic-like serine/threonine-protein kinase
VQPLTSNDPAEVGGYRLRARLGSGGMGRVYLASTPGGRAVALKVVRAELSDDPNFRTRFRQEIEAAQRVHGLYTAQLVDADPDATPPWLVTAYVPGPSLQEAIDDHGPMPEALVFRLIAGVAEALAAIHAAEVVHRDLKPSNVLLAQDGPRVIDFGIARALEGASLTRSGIMMGSPDFLAPEIVQDLPISPALDVFALGSLAVYAATGRPPFGRGNLAAVAHRAVYEAPNLEGCPAGLLTLIEACLEKRAQDRPPPHRIIEFCAAHTTKAPDASQPWLEWGLPRPAAAGFTDSAELAIAQTVNSNDRTSGSADEGRTGGEEAGAAKARKRHVRSGAALAGTALVVAAVITIALTAHLASASNSASSTPGDSTVSASNTPAGRTVRDPAAKRSPVTPGASKTAEAAPSAVRVTHSPAPARSATAPAANSVPSAAAPSPSPSLTPVVLLSQGHPVTASSIQGDPWAAANAVDGNLSTRWSSAFSDPQWLEVNLGATHAIREVILYWENAHATAFQIQTSEDGTTWTDIYSTTTGAGGEQIIEVNGTGRYVRMYGTARNTQYGYSLYEFQILGS